MKKKIIGICALIMSLQAVASNAQIEVRIRQKYNRFSKLYQGSVEVTALDNNVEVHDVIINRGNCDSISEDRVVLQAFGNAQAASRPLKLNYGQSTVFVSNKCQRIREAIVKTNTGTWTFTPRQ